MTTGISWTDETWNPVRGCSRVSAGCTNCYAEVQAARIVRMAKGKPSAYDGLVSVRSKVSGLRYKDVKAAGDFDQPRWTGEVRLVPEQLAWPLRKRKPLRIFVNSMSDLFHESLTNEQIAAVFGVMAACPQHTFQLLTKRAKRMREWFEWMRDEAQDIEGDEYEIPLTVFAALELGDGSEESRERWQDKLSDLIRDGWARKDRDDGTWFGAPWPLPNVWLGVSVENQDAADERIPELLQTPAAVRFLSCEPLIGAVDLEHVKHQLGASSFEIGSCLEGDDGFGLNAPRERIDWVIAGCESGPGARPCDVAWLRLLRDQCDMADVAFFLKQAVQQDDIEEVCEHCHERVRYFVVGPSDTLCGCACCVEGPEAADWHPPIGFGDESRRKPGGVIELPYLDGVQHAAFPEAR